MKNIMNIAAVPREKRNRLHMLKTVARIGLRFFKPWVVIENNREAVNDAPAVTISTIESLLRFLICFILLMINVAFSLLPSASKSKRCCSSLSSRAS